MNSLNNDPNQILNQNNFKSYDIGNRFYQYYRIPNNASVNPAFAPLHNAYGPNQLLATQFSFQYSDNQGLGDGLTTNSHHNVWNGTPINATISPHSRGNQPQTIDHNSAHFFSIPAHGTPQAADQNLFYQYGYNAPNNMYWTHPSLLEYKSNNQNYTLPHTDKSQSWSDALFNSQYPLFSNSINCKSNVSPFDQTNNTLAMNNVETGYQKHLAQNRYQFSKINSTGADISPRSATVERVPGEKSENSVNQDKNFSTVSSSNNIYLQIDSIQSQLSNDCSINKDNSNSETNRISTHNSNQQEYSSALLSKHLSSSNTDRGNNSDFWNQDVNRESKLNNNKSYAKVTKLSSRNSNGYNISNQSSFTQPYINNGISTNPRFNYKSVMNGFATGHSRQIANNNNHQNWFNSTLVNGNSWNTTNKAKWPQDGIRKCVTNSVVEPNMKSNWASKVTFPNSEENIRNAENKIKEIQAQINPIRLDINFEKTRYFVIKSYSEDDIHRSIKYNVWCSTKEGNKRLNDAFQNAQKIGGHVLLFFSVNGSGHFCGIAEMTSVVDENIITGIWCQDKWRGKFSVRWIYVKDVPNTQLRHISTKVKNSKSGESTMEIKPITNLRDATELKSDRGPSTSFKDDPGYQALRIIIDCKSNMSIFDDFLHYENRELLGIES